jgi:hypothetical protein
MSSPRVRAIERDRDTAGRPRNARPRDALGRPLPHDAGGGVERVPDRLDLPLSEAVDLAQRYLDTGRPFHAHEVLEALWKSRPSTERDLWQGLAQLAVGLTHAMRGNRRGAAALLRRGRDRIAAYTGDPHGIDVPGVTAAASALASDIENAPDVRLEGFVLRLA